MLLCGLEKNSFNDYPGKVSCVIFIQGCNFFCPYCHNPLATLKKNSNSISKKKILNFIQKRKKYYDGIVISGGEPTLNKELPALCTDIKKMGYDLKLDTNGSRPKMIEELINKNIIDYISMDLKTHPTKYLLEQFTSEPCIENSIRKSIKLIMDIAPDYEFRTTCVDPFITHDIIEQICSVIKGAKRYILQPFNQNASSILNKTFFINKNPVIPIKTIESFIKITKSMVTYSHISIL